MAMLTGALGLVLTSCAVPTGTITYVGPAAARAGFYTSVHISPCPAPDNVVRIRWDGAADGERQGTYQQNDAGQWTVKIWPALAVGTHHFTFECGTVDAQDTFTVTQTYAPQTFTVTGPITQPTVTPTVAPGGAVHVSDNGGCGTEGPYVIAGVHLLVNSQTRQSIERTPDADGRWADVDLTVPDTAVATDTVTVWVTCIPAFPPPPGQVPYAYFYEQAPVAVVTA